MTELIRRFRGLGVALVVLALSAGAVFAAAPQLGLTGADDPVSAEAPSQGDEASEEPSEAPESEAPDSESSDTEDSVDAPKADAPTVDAPTSDSATVPADNHGALVSAAATMPTPDGFANHGAFVSCVAHMKDMTLATINWDLVTPDTCAAAKAAGHAAGNAKDKSANGAAKSQAATSKDKPGKGKGKGAGSGAPDQSGN